MITYLRYPAPIAPLDAEEKKPKPIERGLAAPAPARRQPGGAGAEPGPAPPGAAGRGGHGCGASERSASRVAPRKEGAPFPKDVFLFAFYRYGVPECALNMEFWNALLFWGISPCSALVGNEKPPLTTGTFALAGLRLRVEQVGVPALGRRAVAHPPHAARPQTMLGGLDRSSGDFRFLGPFGEHMGVFLKTS